MATVHLPTDQPPVPLPAAPTLPPPTTPQPPVPYAAVQRFVFLDADWQMYETMLQALGRRHIRCTYDRGRLEIMTVSLNHERASNLLGRFVETLTLELSLPLLSCGSTTFRRQDLDRGLEPDQCYYLRNEPLVRQKDEIDLAVDPPPDLAIEIDISRSSLDRLGIYAAFGVSEVWVFNNEVLSVYQLSTAGQYSLSESSSHFPFLPLGKLAEFLQRRKEISETQLVREFRSWVREQIAHNWQKPT